ncbi:MAG TPA: Holliday junction resolvase RuvX [Candidatus Onthovivens sp.]|nr:Holliday junction resolvase RuvX [Candidatus Onthovivens sp.]
MNKYIGLDLGTNSLGIVVSDSLGIVHNKENYNFERGNYKKARIHLIELINREQIYNIVIGLPLQIDREEGERCKSVRRFIEDLQKEMDNLKVIFFDESYSTIEARERLEEMGLKKDEIKKRIDMMSAFVILEDYLRSIKNGTN